MAYVCANCQCSCAETSEVLHGLWDDVTKKLQHHTAQLPFVELYLAISIQERPNQKARQKILKVFSLGRPSANKRPWPWKENTIKHTRKALKGRSINSDLQKDLGSLLLDALRLVCLRGPGERWTSCCMSQSVRRWETWMSEIQSGKRCGTFVGTLVLYCISYLAKEDPLKVKCPNVQDCA